VVIQKSVTGKTNAFKEPLLVVLYSTTGEHWKLKAEISWLKKEIEYYMIGFNPHYLMKFNL
jgi:lipopolysaccharide export system protein LptC